MKLRTWFRSNSKTRTSPGSKRGSSRRRLASRPALEGLEDLRSADSIDFRGRCFDERVWRGLCPGNARERRTHAPHDLVLGPDGNIYVASRNSNGGPLQRLDREADWNVCSTGSGGVSVSHGLAFGPDGNLYVGSGGDGTNSSVLRFNGTTGAFIDTFVSAGSGGLNRTFGFVFGADGNLYVASGQTNSGMRDRGPLGASPGSPLPSTGQTGANFVPPNSGGLTSPTDLVLGQTVHSMSRARRPMKRC